MDERNIHSDSSYSDQFPVNIPSADDAWDDMKKRLKKDKKRFTTWLIVFSMIALLLLSIVVSDISKLNRNKKINAVSQNINTEKIIDSNKKAVTLDNDLSKQKVENPSAVTHNEETIASKKNTQKKFSANTVTTNILNNKSTASPGKRKSNLIQTKSPKPSSSDQIKNNTGITNKNNLAAVKNNPPGNNHHDANANIPDKKLSANTRVFSDSVYENNNSDDDVETKDVVTEAGLQWTAQLPFANASSYFTGPNTNSQPYRLILPGVWLSLRAEKSLMSIVVNPFASALVSNKPFNTYTYSSSASDTIVTTSVTSTLNKLFGISAGLGYAYNITGKWWLGGNVQANWWSKGIATSKIEVNKKSPGGSFSDINTSSNNQYALNDSTWESFSKFQVSLSVEILYRKKIWQAGLHAGLPVTPLAKDKGPANPFYAELFFRLRLWSDEKKKQ